MPADRVSGVILAGGKSLRMGRDKALLEIHGQSMIVRTASELSAVTDEIVISANDPARYQALGFPVIPDIYIGQGPLAGLHAAMARTTRALVLLLACDLPRINSRHLLSLIDRSRGFDAVVPRSSDGLAHPLCALYRRSCFTFLDAALARQMNKMTFFLGNPPLKVRWLSPEDGCFADEDLINLNSPSDLDDYIASIR